MNPKKYFPFSTYDDQYATCERTYATLCIYLPDQINPDTITEELDIKPSRIQSKGEIKAGRTKNWPTAWFLSTDGVVKSKDVRRHLDWLIENLAGKDKIVRKIQAIGGKTEISCFWLSSIGHGGPSLSPNIMSRLGELGIGIWFDVYFDKSDDELFPNSL